MSSTDSDSSSQHEEVDYSKDSSHLELAFNPSNETASPKLLLNLIEDSVEEEGRYRDKEYEQDPDRDLLRLDAQQAERVKQQLQDANSDDNPKFVDEITAIILETNVDITLEMLEKINWPLVVDNYLPSLTKPDQFLMVMKSRKPIVIQKTQRFQPPKLDEDIDEQFEVFEEAIHSATVKLKGLLTKFNGAKIRSTAKRVFASRLIIALIEKHSTYDNGSVLSYLMENGNSTEDEQEAQDPREEGMSHSKKVATPEAEPRQRTPSKPASEKEHEEEEKEEYDEGVGSEENNSGPNVSTRSSDHIRNNEDEGQYRAAVNWMKLHCKPNVIVDLLKTYVEKASADQSEDTYVRTLKNIMYDLQTQVYTSRDMWQQYVRNYRDAVGINTFPGNDTYMVDVFTGQYLSPQTDDHAPQMMKLFKFLVNLLDQDGNWTEPENLPFGCGNPECPDLVFGKYNYCCVQCKTDHMLSKQRLENLTASSGTASTNNHSEAPSKEGQDKSPKKIEKSNKKTKRARSIPAVMSQVLEIHVDLSSEEWQAMIRLLVDILSGAKNARTQKVITKCSIDQTACQEDTGKKHGKGKHSKRCIFSHFKCVLSAVHKAYVQCQERQTQAGKILTQRRAADSVLTEGQTKTLKSFYESRDRLSDLIPRITLLGQRLQEALGAGDIEETYVTHIKPKHALTLKIIANGIPRWYIILKKQAEALMNKAEEASEEAEQQHFAAIRTPGKGRRQVISDDGSDNGESGNKSSHEEEDPNSDEASSSSSEGEDGGGGDGGGGDGSDSDASSESSNSSSNTSSSGDSSDGDTRPSKGNNQPLLKMPKEVNRRDKPNKAFVSLKTLFVIEDHVHGTKEQTQERHTYMVKGFHKKVLKGRVLEGKLVLKKPVEIQYQTGKICERFLGSKGNHLDNLIIPRQPQETARYNRDKYPLWIKAFTMDLITLILLTDREIIYIQKSLKEKELKTLSTNLPAMAEAARNGLLPVIQRITALIQKEFITEMQKIQTKNDRIPRMLRMILDSMKNSNIEH